MTLRILHVTAPGRVGGLESVVLGLAGGHTARGHRVSVFASLAEDRAEHPFLDALADAGVRVHVPRLSSKGYLEERSAIRSVIAAETPSIVHSHGYRADVIGLLATSGHRVARLTTVHGFTGGDWKNRMYERVQLRAFRRFDAVVAVSRPLLGRITASGVPSERVHLIPNAFAAAQPSLTRTQARDALGLSDRDVVLGWVGRLSREKALDVMLDALLLLDDLPISLAVLGNGREMETLQRRAEETGLSPRITWHGTVAEGSRYFPAFDLYMLTSHTEGTPITLLEAMNAGVPIVATAVGGVPDVLTEREAWLVPPGNAPAIAAAVRQAWSDREERQQRAEAAASKLAEHYSGGPWLDRYEALYHGILTQRHSALRTGSTG